MMYFSRGNLHHPTILFLHGFMGDRHDFDEVISSLTDQFRCLSLDIPNEDMATAAQTVIELLDQLQITPCFLVGYSMGGRLALYLTIHFPERFIKVVLESASPGLQTEAERQQRRQQDERLAAELVETDFAAFLSKWYEQPLFKGIERSPQFHQMMQRRLQNNPLELAKSLRCLGTGAQPSLWAELVENQVPLLLVVGEWDRKFVRINQEMAALSPVAQLQVIKDCGHTVHFEKGDLFESWIRAFFS